MDLKEAEEGINKTEVVTNTKQAAKAQTEAITVKVIGIKIKITQMRTKSEVVRNIKGLEVSLQILIACQCLLV